MRTYESIFIVHPEVVGDDQTAIIEKYKTILTDQGAEVIKIDNWGVKTLAYPVKKQTKGCYVLAIFEADPTIISEYERRMRIDDKVIKFQTIYLENGYEAPPVVEAAPEAAPAEASPEASEEVAEEAVEAPVAAEAPAEEKTEEA